MKILTGIRPTNILHVGNLFGALLPAAALQREHDLFMMVADYHALTTLHDADQLRDNVLFATAAYIAAGIDPKKTVLFQQSRVSAHAELAWVLQTIAYMGEASRMTQFKDKSDGKKRIPVGLFSYPVLMAADILLYSADAVPVGADQKQHLEFARDLAGRFNSMFGETFTVPEPRIRESGAAKIMSLQDPSRKMSKSDPSAKSYLSIMDEPDVVAKKIRSAVTDSERGITASPDRAGLFNLLTLYSLCNGESVGTISGKYADKGMKELKDDLAEQVVAVLAPIQAGVRTLLDDKDELLRVIELGSRAAREVADAKMKVVKERIGVI